ncbi:hypothetical protein Tco_1512455, partial [Tanacetum coccineum]
FTLSKNDQQQQPAKRHKQPSNQRLSLSVKFDSKEFSEGNCAFRSLGPLTSVIAAALVTHTTVPMNFAMVLKLRILFDERRWRLGGVNLYRGCVSTPVSAATTLDEGRELAHAKDPE